MKQKVKRSTARTRAKRANPRYLISRDGVEVGIYPGFTSVEAVKRAKAQYGQGKYTAEKISADLYLGRGGEEIAARERRQRREEYRAERLSQYPTIQTKNPPYSIEHRAPTSTTGAPAYDLTQVYPADVYQHPEWYDAEPEAMQIHRMLRTARNKPKAKLTVYRAIPKGIKSGINSGDWITLSRKYAALHGQKVFGAKNYQILKATIPAEFIWFDGNSILESGFDNSIKNGTHIHAENIDHLDVSRVHNPSNSDEFVAVSYFNRNALADDVIFLPLAEPYDVKRTFDTIAYYKGAGAYTFPIYLGIGENEYGEPEQYQRLDKYVIVDTVNQTVQPLATNPQRPVTRYEYTLGTWWQPYIAYGDDSDVSIEEIQQWEAFRKRLPPGGHWSFTEDTYFGKDEITGKRGDVSDAYYVIVG